MTVTFEDSARSGVSTAGWLLPHESQLDDKVAAGVFTPPDDQRRETQWLGKLDGGGRQFVGKLVLDQLRSVLGEDLSELLAGGVTAHNALRVAARESLDKPESLAEAKLFRTHVETDQHVDVHITHAPAFDLVVPFELDLDFTFGTAYAQVLAGRMMSLDVREAQVEGTVKVHGRKVWGRLDRLPGSGHFSWAKGLPIILREAGPGPS